MHAWHTVRAIGCRELRRDASQKDYVVLPTLTRSSRFPCIEATGTDTHDRRSHAHSDERPGLDVRWVFPSFGKTWHIEAWDHKEVPGTLHSLRHMFATVGVEAGVPEEVMG